MPKIVSLPLADRLHDLDVRIVAMAWLPAAGVTFEHLPDALDALRGILPGHTEMSVVKQLPALEPLTHQDEVDESDLCSALEGIEGFLFLMETPKRRWFSDGTPRLNWGDTYHQWGYAPEPDLIEDVLARFVTDVVEGDQAKYPRVFAEETQDS